MEPNSTTNETKTKVPCRIERRATEALEELDTVRAELVNMLRTELVRDHSEDDDVECAVMAVHKAFTSLARARELVECIYDPSLFELEDAEREEARLAVQQ